MGAIRWLLTFFLRLSAFYSEYCPLSFSAKSSGSTFLSCAGAAHPELPKLLLLPGNGDDHVQPQRRPHGPVRRPTVENTMLRYCLIPCLETQIWPICRKLNLRFATPQTKTGFLRWLLSGCNMWSSQLSIQRVSSTIVHGSGISDQLCWVRSARSQPSSPMLSTYSKESIQDLDLTCWA